MQLRLLGTGSPTPLPERQGAIVHALFEQVYAREIAFSHALAHATATPLPDIRAVVPVITIDANQSYCLDEWQVTTAAVDHGHRLGLSYEEWPCLAYRVEMAGRSVVVSGDCVLQPA